MTISIKIIDRVLRQDFGFQHLLWIYSGRRGVHCWISDPRARKLTAEGRRAIVGYLEVVKGGENQTRRVNLAPNRGLPPTMQLAYKELNAWFETIVVEQDLMGEKESWDKVLALVPDEEIRRKCDTHWTNKGARLSSIDKWGQLVSEVESGRKVCETQLMNSVKSQRLQTRSVISCFSTPTQDWMITSRPG
jgi:DNA primase small subunit